MDSAGPAVGGGTEGHDDFADCQLLLGVDPLWAGVFSSIRPPFCLYQLGASDSKKHGPKRANLLDALHSGLLAARAMGPHDDRWAGCQWHQLVTPLNFLQVSTSTRLRHDAPTRTRRTRRECVVKSV